MKVHELLSSPEKWTQSTAARNGTGEPVPIHHPTATCWCLWGAVNKCYLVDPQKRCEVELSLKRRLGGYVLWNDTEGRTYEEVIAVCKELDI